MRIFLILFFCVLSSIALANATEECNITQSMEYGFTGNNSKDLVELHYSEKPCKDAKLTLVIRKQNGQKIYEYEYSYMPGFYDYEDPNYQEYITVRMGVLLENMKGTSDSIPLREKCPKKTECLTGYFPNADIDHASNIPFDKYQELRATPVLTITHPVGREAWLTIYFDVKSEKVTELALSSV